VKGFPDIPVESRILLILPTKQPFGYENGEANQTFAGKFP
jgi:hypothetical protein